MNQPIYTFKELSEEQKTNAAIAYLSGTQQAIDIETQMDQAEYDMLEWLIIELKKQK